MILTSPNIKESSTEITSIKAKVVKEPKIYIVSIGVIWGDLIGLIKIYKDLFAKNDLWCTHFGQIYNPRHFVILLSTIV